MNISVKMIREICGICVGIFGVYFFVFLVYDGKLVEFWLNFMPEWAALTTTILSFFGLVILFLFLSAVIGWGGND